MTYADDHELRKAQARADGRSDIVDAHSHAAGHRVELNESQLAGCFYCCAVFAPSEIEDWIDNNGCALCPRCGIDSVIGDASGFPATDKNFLKNMNEFWF